MGKLTISMVIFIGHVSLPEGNGDSKTVSTMWISPNQQLANKNGRWVLGFLFQSQLIRPLFIPKWSLYDVDD